MGVAACAALFAPGIKAYRQGWLTAVPGRLRRQCRTVTLAGGGAFAAFALCARALGVPDEQLAGGWHWPALVFAALESTLTVSGPVWVLGAAQQHLSRPHRWAGPAVSRSGYGAFMVQSPVLIGLAVVLRPLPAAAEIKALIVASGGIAGSFARARLLISRIPVIARIL